MKIRTSFVSNSSSSSFVAVLHSVEDLDKLNKLITRMIEDVLDIYQDEELKKDYNRGLTHHFKQITAKEARESGCDGAEDNDGYVYAEIPFVMDCTTEYDVLKGVEYTVGYTKCQIIERHS